MHPNAAQEKACEATWNHNAGSISAKYVRRNANSERHPDPESKPTAKHGWYGTDNMQQQMPRQRNIHHDVHQRHVQFTTPSFPLPTAKTEATPRVVSRTKGVCMFMPCIDRGEETSTCNTFGDITLICEKKIVTAAGGKHVLAKARQ
jgi:hypothetical protein